MAAKLCVEEAQKAPPKKIKYAIKVIPERCKGCGYCIAFCPKKVLSLSKESNSKGYHIPVASRLEACIGCKLCELICPDFCIFVEKNNKE